MHLKVHWISIKIILIPNKSMMNYEKCFQNFNQFSCDISFANFFSTSQNTLIQYDIIFQISNP